jgi:hypothetical protein
MWCFNVPKTYCKVGLSEMSVFAAKYVFQDYISQKDYHIAILKLFARFFAYFWPFLNAVENNIF